MKDDTAVPLSPQLRQQPPYGKPPMGTAETIENRLSVLPVPCVPFPLRHVRASACGIVPSCL